MYTPYYMLSDTLSFTVPPETIFHARINPLRLTFMYIIYQNSVSTALRMQSASDSKTTQLMLFREVIAV